LHHRLNGLGRKRPPIDIHMPKLGVLGRNSAKELILQYTDTVVAEREREREREKEIEP
jgi:hypothetical protein